VTLLPSLTAVKSPMKKQRLFALLALVLLLVGCPSTPPGLDAGEQRIPDATPVEAGHRVGSYNPTPSGTGLRHVVSGVESSAASLIVDADVNVISGSKITPNFGAQALSTTGTAAFGATPATVGALRLPASFDERFRNNANTQDMFGLSADATDNLYIGVGSGFASATQVGQIAIYGTTNVQLGTGSSVGIVVRNTPVVNTYYQITLAKAMIGDSASSSPFGVHGLASVALPTGANATTTLTASVYAYNTIQTTAALTANQNVVLPTATDAAAYTKVINNICTGAFAVIVQCTAGVFVTIANGKSAMVLVDSRGVTRLTPDT
jgi:hypothetical protein